MKIVMLRLPVLASAAALTFMSLSAAAFAAPSATTGDTGATIASAQAASDSPTERLCTDAPRPGQMACMSVKLASPAEPKVFKTRAVTAAATPSGYSPAQLRRAYKLTASGTAAQTVAIVDAYDDPSAEQDLAVYRKQFGLAACTTANHCFRKVNQSGQASPLPDPDTDWAGEISLDLDMVSAICPGCHILLVEANSSSSSAMFAAVDRAVAMGAKFVSNSWGGPESSYQTSYDVHFNHPGVAFTVSSGDYGYGAEYPATSKYVTAVGGTSLTPASNARGFTERAWAGAGSGCSSYDAKASWQGVTTGCSKRAVADVSAVADPDTGVAVYQTFGESGWNVYGGTSVAAPIIAATYALAGTPAAGTYPAAYPYAHAANLFDAGSGSNGSCGSRLCTAGTGWDGPTGLGTPNGTAAFTNQAAPLSLTSPGNRAAIAASATTLSLRATGGSKPYRFSATGLPAGLRIAAASGVISGKPAKAGTYTVKVTLGDAKGHTTTATFKWTVAAAGSCSTRQLLGNRGFETGSGAPWAVSSSDVIDGNNDEAAHSGSYKAWLGGTGTTHTDTISQKSTIPTGCATAKLSFYLHIETDEVTKTAKHDTMTVKIGSKTLATYSNLNAAAGYTRHTFSVARFAGQTISFSGTENNSKVTSFVLDDTSLTGS